MKTKDLDIVYIVKKSESNEELRYSLRSINANFPHRKVFIAGYKPTWVKNVEHIPVDQKGKTKYENARNNWLAVVKDPRVSKKFVSFNDDFFVMHPVDALKVYHRGDLHDVYKEYSKKYPSGNYTSITFRTYSLLRDLEFKHPVCYDLHVPYVMDKRKRHIAYELHKIINPFEYPTQMHSFYGNFWRLGGEQIDDVKIVDLEKLPDSSQPYVSTSDNSFKMGKVGRVIRKKFPNRCRYEVL